MYFAALLGSFGSILNGLPWTLDMISDVALCSRRQERAELRWGSCVEGQRLRLGAAQPLKPRKCVCVCFLFSLSLSLYNYIPERRMDRSSMIPRVVDT